MKARLSLFLAATSVALAALPAFTARRPRYGGTLVIDIGAGVKSADPTVAASNPGEAQAKQWIDELIYARRNPDGTFAGAGPFRIQSWTPDQQAVLAANEQFSGSRPFLDAIQIQMGRALKDRLIDLDIGKADLAVIPSDEARRASETGIRISRSQPDELIALAFNSKRAAVADARVREAIASTIDRAAIVNFILQRGGEPAGALLPQWSSGTSFLFSTGSDPNHAKELWSQVAAPPTILLGYDSGDSQTQAIAERIEVNAQGAGISMAVRQVSNDAAVQSSVDARLVRLRMPSASPQTALSHFLDVLNPIAAAQIDPASLADPAGPQQIYDAESAIIRSYSVVPIAWIPQVYGLSNRVRDWNAPGPGEAWPLANVWLDNVDAQPEKGSS
jgi:ABC-type transport system substrate-binding protein